MRRRILLLCGVLVPLSYALADALAGMRWPGYSFRDQVISELGAIGAPSRTLFSVLLIAVYLFLVALGIGVWHSAGGSRRLRVVAGLVLGLGIMVLAAMGVAATALGRRFRVYTFVTIAVVLAFGAWSGMDIPRIEAGLATPWAGVKERIFWYAYQTWFAVLGLTLLDRGR